jgi:hypothetical protein
LAQLQASSPPDGNGIALLPDAPKNFLAFGKLVLKADGRIRSCFSDDTRNL